MCLWRNPICHDQCLFFPCCKPEVFKKTCFWTGLAHVRCVRNFFPSVCGPTLNLWHSPAWLCPPGCAVLLKSFRTSRWACSHVSRWCVPGYPAKCVPRYPMKCLPKYPVKVVPKHPVKIDLIINFWRSTFDHQIVTVKCWWSNLTIKIWWSNFDRQILRIKCWPSKFDHQILTITICSSNSDHQNSSIKLWP